MSNDDQWKSRRDFVEAFSKFQAEDDKQPVEIITGARLRVDGGRFAFVGGTVTNMTKGLYRKLFPSKD